MGTFARPAKRESAAVLRRGPEVAASHISERLLSSPFSAYVDACVFVLAWYLSCLQRRIQNAIRIRRKGEKVSFMPPVIYHPGEPVKTSGLYRVVHYTAHPNPAE